MSGDPPAPEPATPAPAARDPDTPAQALHQPVPAGREPRTVASPGLEPRVLNVLRGESERIRATPFGQVGTIHSGSGIELVWVSKQAEAIDQGWFSSGEVDVLLVMQGRLKVEFDHPELPDRVLDAGDVLVLPPNLRCRAYRWPREARGATVFVAAYPVGNKAPADS